MALSNYRRLLPRSNAPDPWRYFAAKLFTASRGDSALHGQSADPAYFRGSGLSKNTLDCGPHQDKFSNFVLRGMGMDVRKRSRCWLVLTFGDDRSHAGNLGYADEPTSSYEYDSDVPNHMRVSAGDTVLIRDQQTLLGVATIGEILTTEKTKTRQRCPICRTAKVAERTTSLPRFRCNRGHEFDNPVREDDACIGYEARFATFVRAVDGVPIPSLRAACPKYTPQGSIQEIEPDAIRWGLEAAAADAAALLPATGASESIPLVAPDDGDELVAHGDEREVVSRAIRIRRGQSAFRKALAARYGAQCMVTGCELFDIVEAAHIAPYRGLADNAPVNGILLRADLHTLFDLDLFGIEPESLRIHFHPLAAAAGYLGLADHMLGCASTRPSGSALRARWDQFRQRSLASV